MMNNPKNKPVQKSDFLIKFIDDFIAAFLGFLIGVNVGELIKYVFC